MAASSRSIFLAGLLCPGLAIAQSISRFSNPILPGFHPDPSCIFVPEANDTFFCATSSFNAFPGIPVYASRDLTHWRHLSKSYLQCHDHLPQLVAASSISLYHGCMTEDFLQHHSYMGTIMPVSGQRLTADMICALLKCLCKPAFSISTGRTE